MELNEYEKTMVHVQELGLQLNEMKSKGETKVLIKDYEQLLDSYINLLRYTENLHNILHDQKLNY